MTAVSGKFPLTRLLFRYSLGTRCLLGRFQSLETLSGLLVAVSGRSGDIQNLIRSLWPFLLLLMKTEPTDPVGTLSCLHLRVLLSFMTHKRSPCLESPGQRV